MTGHATFELTPAQMAAGFALLGEGPASGPLSVLPPVNRATAKILLADTGLTIDSGNLSEAASGLFGVLAAPGRKVTSTVITPLATGVATSTFFAPAEGGPFVAYAETDTGFAVSRVDSAAAVAVVVGGYLGLAGEPEPIHGDAVELTAAGWAVLGALADLDEPASIPGAVRRALGKKPGRVVEVFRTIAPAGASDPGSKGIHEAGNWLGGAGLAIRMHDNRLQPTRSGRAVLRALRNFVTAGSVTVDHLTEAGPLRAVSLSSIRTPERLFFGVWRVEERGPVIALGEPGADSVATTVRTLIESPNVLPPPRAAIASIATTAAASGAAMEAMSDSAPGPPPPPEPPSAPGRVGKIEPPWLKYVIGSGLALALAGAAFGLSGGEDASGTSLAPGQAIVDLDRSTTTVVDSESSTIPFAESSTIAPPTTAETATTTVAISAVPTTAAEETTTTASSTTTTTAPTTTSSTTTTTTTTTLPPGILVLDTFDDGITAAAPLVGPELMTSSINGDGQLEIGVFTAGVVPTMYPDPVPDGVEISFDFFPQPASLNASFGAVVMSEDPSDGIIGYYIGIFTFPNSSGLAVIPWDDGWGTVVESSVPGAASFAANQWNTMRLVVSGGQVEIHLNGQFVTTWIGVTPVISGHWGFLVAGEPGEVVLIDNVVVQMLG